MHAGAVAIVGKMKIMGMIDRARAISS